MQRTLIAMCVVGLVAGAAAQQTAPPTPPQPATGTTTQDGGTIPPPQGGRGIPPGTAIGAPPPIFLPPPAFNAPNVGAGAVSGVVTDASTGAPLEGALVSLTGSGTPGQPLVNRRPQMTDSKGRFIFPNLAPSTAYIPFASRPGYLSAGYRRLPGMSGPGIKLADGQWFGEANIKLWRTSAISGIVLDERGEPFVGVPIRILVGATVAGRWRWAGGAMTHTDDRGMYRFAGLSKGALSRARAERSDHATQWRSGAL